MKVILGTTYYDYEEVGKLLGVGVVSVRKYIKKYGLQAKVIDRKKYLTESEIKRYLSLTK